MGVARRERPIAVLMSGAPGSGKSTLAGLLAEQIRVPVVSKDRLRQGTLWALRTRDIDTAPLGPPLWSMGSLNRGGGCEMARWGCVEASCEAWSVCAPVGRG
jgi:hypothetical protein